MRVKVLSDAQQIIADFGGRDINVTETMGVVLYSGERIVGLKIEASAWCPINISFALLNITKLTTLTIG